MTAAIIASVAGIITGAILGTWQAVRTFRSRHPEATRIPWR